MKLIALVMLGLLLITVFVNAAYARQIERVTIPYTAANADETNPAHYFFQSKHVSNWLLTIRNGLEYNSNNPDGKVIIRLKDEPKSQNFIEIAMFGAPTYTLQAGFKNDQLGYVRYYEKASTPSEKAWSTDTPISLGFELNRQLSINNGARIIMDRITIGEFALGTIEIFGKNSTNTADNAVGGELVFEAIDDSGSIFQTPIMYVPLIISGVVAGTIVTLVKFKKRI